jgi:hypothetical protein
MRRFGFRRVLPLVFTAVHIALVWSTLPRQSQESTNLRPELAYLLVVFQEGTSVPIEMSEPPPLKPWQKIAAILDLPAMFVAMLTVSVLFPRNELASMYASVVLAPLVWYGVGRWVDGLLGYIPPWRISRSLRRVFFFLFSTVLCVSIAGVTPLYHHRTADSYWIFAGLILWCGLCLAITASSPDKLSPV